MPKIYFLTTKTNELNCAFATFLTVTFAFADREFIFAPPISKRSVRLGVRTSDFHSGNTGSIPVRTTKAFDNQLVEGFVISNRFVNNKPLNRLSIQSAYWSKTPALVGVQRATCYKFAS